ncbi:MAG TPA: UDP-N-acetylmuramoyl-L-alanine--D-glutamate ligase, partial [Pseudoxanthomonas sp.]|nr:UDP-N-acetylmuramoyl-L-alanine--D-glutamate ligase [Pseudoxanthomonas sp.]
MRISRLEARRVALWGWGREGRAAYRAVRAQLPALPLTLFCGMDESTQAAALADPRLDVQTEVDGARLAAFEIVIKSPGISPYGEAGRAASGAGTRFIGGSTLWFDENPDARTLCVTGTKGKSTTTALLHRMLSAKYPTHVGGNLGGSLLPKLGEIKSTDLVVLELSSYML